MLEFEGKIAIVTGGAQGIGGSAARILSERGATVIISDINAEKAAKTAEACGPNCVSYPGDISDSAYQENLVNFVVEKYGRIDVLVNNAGITSPGGFLEMTEALYDKIMDINLKAAVFLAQRVLDQMIKQNYGRIVCTGSLSGHRGGLFVTPAYALSKAAIMNLVKCMAMKGGPNNVTVNGIAPGLINTSMNDTLHFSEEEINRIALRRMGTPDEVAEVIAFLASDRASYVSGCIVDINGGQYMH